MNLTQTSANLRICDTSFVKQNGLKVVTSLPVALYARYDGGVGPLGNDDLGDTRQYLLLPTNLLSSHYPTADGSYYGIIVAIQDGTIIIVGGRQVTFNKLDVYYSNEAITSASAPFAYIIICLQKDARGSIVPDAKMAYPSSFASRFISTTPSRLPFDIYYNVYAL